MAQSYAVLFERTDNGYSCLVPDIAGCYAAGATLEEARRLIVEGIAFHIEGMLLDGELVPPPATHAEMVSVNVPEPSPNPDPHKVIQETRVEAVVR